ncbi:hypothetical protein [Clostridium saccharobutylicum]|uniref:DUF4116 domain-containing protein n=1 Tax=Clostridium saccharobutylicum TaxID=169679 RepID=A0A1S8NIZ1_CLOSA|nr:hypothetical protein [Clostridium saccharobutylicum]OOM16420.1 hypothetical protein CLOSAC_06910 [Clostridium saccharobutylicum]
MEKENILLKLKSNPSYIKELSEADEELKLLIVKDNGNNIKYIKNPSKEVQKEAIKSTPLSIQYIENVNEEIGILCVRTLWNSLELINNPSETIIEEAVQTKGWAIQFVKNPSEKLQILAVNKDYDAIKYITNPSEIVQLKAIENYYAAIRFIKNPTLKAKIKSIKSNGEAINYISNYDLDELKIFISENINVVKYIYESIDVETVVEVLMEKVKNETIEKKYIEDFLELEILDMDKINFIREYGSKNAKKILVDYKLSM